jgi:hypothetical protein
MTGPSDSLRTKPTTLYRFFDAESVLLYIGITARGLARWHQHADDKPWWPQVASCTTEHFPSRAEAYAAEREAIRTERPRYNVIRPGERRPPRTARRPSTPVAPKRHRGREVELVDLLNARRAADLLGLARPSTVSAYRCTYPDFPDPVLPNDLAKDIPQPGVGLYWLRRDILKWRAKHPAIGRHRSDGDDVTPPA